MGHFDIPAGGEGVGAAAESLAQDRSEVDKIFFSNVPITSQHVSRLLIISQMARLGLCEWDPLRDFRFLERVSFLEGIGDGADWGDAGGSERRWGRAWEGYNEEGVRLLEALRGLEVYRIELRLLDRFERSALVRMAEVVEENRARRKRLKGRWQKRRNHEQARWRRAARKAKEKRLMKKAESEKEQQKEKVDKMGPNKSEGGANESEVAVKVDEVAEGIKVVMEPAAEAPERAEVELEVVRVGPNPRVLQCQYRLLADVIKINVWVKKNANFRRSMKLVMAEQEGAEWKWEGALPRHPGRW